MNYLKPFIVALLFILPVPVFAQFVNPDKSSKKFNNRFRVALSYNPVNINTDRGDAENLDLQGISASILECFSINRTLPFYIETGIRLSYSWLTEEDECAYVIATGNVYSILSVDITQKLKYVNIAIPVNLAYRFSFSNTDISITPYAGIILKYNILGRIIQEVTAEDIKGIESEMEYNYNMFDKDDVGRKNTWNRLQFGWNAGVRIGFSRFDIGIGYGKDFSELGRKLKTDNFIISLGFST